ncbi:hypothetical protein A9Z65_00530 [Moraxella nonliquefaciens]|nr:hypothetical protein A9Z65_00530 [Moraxella nonliquefaciens]
MYCAGSLVVLYTTYTAVLSAGIKCLSQLPKMPAFYGFCFKFQWLKNLFTKIFYKKFFKNLSNFLLKIQI